jgi:hypothetical protein
LHNIRAGGIVAPQLNNEPGKRGQRSPGSESRPIERSADLRRLYQTLRKNAHAHPIGFRWGFCLSRKKGE